MFVYGFVGLVNESLWEGLVCSLGIFVGFLQRFLVYDGVVFVF